MKTARLAVMVLAMLVCAPVFAVQDSRDAATRSPKETKVGSNVYDIGSGRYPAASGRNFTVIRGGVGSGINIGCAGADLENILSGYFNLDFKSVMDYIKANAAGMALTYLIYSNPTLYSLLQDLKKAGDFALNLNMLSCGQIRGMADNARNKAIAARALDECQAKYGASGVQDGARIEECKKDVIKKYEDDLKSKSYNANATVNSFLTGNMDLSPELRQLIDDVIPTEKATGGDISKNGPTKTPSMMMHESYQEYLQKLGKIVNDARTGKLKSQGDLGELAGREGLEPVHPDVIAALLQYPPNERDVVIDRLAARLAYGDMVAKIRKASEVVRVAMLQGKTDVTLFEYQKIDVRNALGVLDNMMSTLRIEYEALDDQRTFMRNIIKSAPNAH